MSGSGGGGILPTPDTGRSCDDIDFETTLASPDPDLVAALQAGQELDVALMPATGNSEVLLVVVRLGQDTLGSIVASLPELIRCLQQGRRFRAEVLSVEEGVVRVRVRPR